MENLLNIGIRSIFIDNMIFAYFLGMCSFLAISKKVKTAFGLGIAVVFVLGVTVPINWLIQNYVLNAGALAWLGDDFAGMREWHPGDSLRHVDWRAVARGRPLMVKQWAAGAGGAVTLDWEQLELPVPERAGQIARWIEECEISGTPYALRLPEADRQ